MNSRGFLTNKAYKGTNDPAYTYTTATGLLFHHEPLESFRLKIEQARGHTAAGL